MAQFKDKNILIAGGSGGIGAETAKQMVEEDFAPISFRTISTRFIIRWHFPHFFGGHNNFISGDFTSLFY